MIEIIQDIKVYYPNKLQSRRTEVVDFAKELISENKNCYQIKIWENKRHDLMGKILKKKEE